jgi:hypothetical protein
MRTARIGSSSLGCSPSGRCSPVRVFGCASRDEYSIPILIGFAASVPYHVVSVAMAESSAPAGGIDGAGSLTSRLPGPTPARARRIRGIEGRHRQIRLDVAGARDEADAALTACHGDYPSDASFRQYRVRYHEVRELGACGVGNDRDDRTSRVLSECLSWRVRGKYQYCHTQCAHLAHHGCTRTPKRTMAVCVALSSGVTLI